MLIFHGSADTTLLPAVSDQLLPLLPTRYLSRNRNVAKDSRIELQRDHQAVDGRLQLLGGPRVDRDRDAQLGLHQDYLR